MQRVRTLAIVSYNNNNNNNNCLQLLSDCLTVEYVHEVCIMCLLVTFLAYDTFGAIASCSVDFVDGLDSVTRSV